MQGDHPLVMPTPNNGGAVCHGYKNVALKTCHVGFDSCAATTSRIAETTTAATTAAAATGTTRSVATTYETTTVTTTTITTTTITTTTATTATTAMSVSTAEAYAGDDACAGCIHGSGPCIMPGDHPFAGLSNPSGGGGAICHGYKHAASKTCHVGFEICSAPIAAATTTSATAETTSTTATIAENAALQGNAESGNSQRHVVAVVAGVAVVAILTMLIIIVKMQRTQAAAADKSSINNALNTFRRASVQNPQIKMDTLRRKPIASVENATYSAFHGIASADTLRQKPIESVENATYSALHGIASAAVGSRAEITVASSSVIYSIPVEPTLEVAGGSQSTVYAIPMEPPLDRGTGSQSTTLTTPPEASYSGYAAPQMPFGTSAGVHATSI
eukprot:gene25997-23591_t